MSKIVVLGANGQLGTDLGKVLAANGYDFTGLNRQNFDPLADNVAEKLTPYFPGIIINCIATTNVDGCEDNPDQAFLINSSFVFKLARFCNERQITLIHISTDYVFNGSKLTPYTEADLPAPLNIYGLSKSTGDLALSRYHDKFFIFRVSSLFGKAGASGKGGNFITTMQKLGRERDRIEVIGDQITCPTATLDIARAIVHIISKNIDDYGVYNCVSSNSCSWFEFAQKIFTLSGLDAGKVHPAKFATYQFKAQRPQYGILSVDKLSKYYTMPTWQESLNEYFS